MANIQVRRFPNNDIAYSHNGTVLLCSNKAKCWVTTPEVENRSQLRLIKRAFEMAKAKSGVNSVSMVSSLSISEEKKSVILHSEEHPLDLKEFKASIDV